MLLGVIAWFQLIKTAYNETAALLSSLLLVITPFIVEFSRMVMSEIPTLSLIMITIYFFYKYCETDRRKYAFAFSVALLLSIYAKHIAIFLIPVMILYLLIRKGIRSLIKQEIIIASLVAAVFLLPLIYITWNFSHANLSDNDMVILRADKILATSKMNWIVEERIKNREEIYDILKTYGIRYIVMEDARSMSQAIEWLREEVTLDKFILQKEIVIHSDNPRVNNVPLKIYEYREFSPPMKGQILKMKIPLMGDTIELPFDELL